MAWKEQLLITALCLIFIHQTVLPTSQCSEFEDFSEINLQDLLDQVVITASRYEQKVSESPLATTVISAEEIRSSGATTIPDLLRMVPGLDVMFVSASDFNLSARGFNQLIANKMLVLIDGRSVYQDFYGLILWETLPVILEDIKSIEVIRGPGSAMYGANAFAGVINIITWPPEDALGTQFVAMGGEYDSYRGSALHAGHGGDLAYKFSLGFKGGNSWREPNDFAHQQVRGNFSLHRKFNEDKEVTLAGGVFGGLIELFPQPTFGFSDLRARGRGIGYMKANYQSEKLSAQLFYDFHHSHLTPQDPEIFLPSTNLAKDTYDAEIQHTFSIGDKHHLIWGGNYRNIAMSWGILDRRVRQDLYSGFAHDEYRPNDNLILYMGGRLDHHPLVKERVSPRGGLVWNVKPNNIVRLSMGSAFRNPSMMESYWSLDYDISPGVPANLSGTRDLDPERIESYEIGYQSLIKNKVIANFSLFYNKIDQFIIALPVSFYPSPPAPYPGIPSALQWSNYGEVEVRGGEVALDILLGHNLKVQANYAYVHYYDIAAKTVALEVPEHKVNVGVWGKCFSHFTYNLRWHFTSKTEWAWTEFTRIGEGVTPAEGIINGQFSYRTADDKTELFVAAVNLLDNRYREYPVGELGSQRFQFGVRVKL